MIKNGYLLKVNDDQYKFSFPNGDTNVYSFINKEGRKIFENNRYSLVFKEKKLIDLLPQKEKMGFSKSLKDLGYIQDINLNPSKTKFNFELPVTQNIIKNEISLELHLEKASFLNKNIYVDIFINNEYIKTIALKDSNIVHKYSVDLNNNNIDLNDDLNIKIETNYTTYDMKTSSNKYFKKAWVTLNNNSKVHFSMKEQPLYNINNFLNMEVEEIKLLHDQNLSRNLMEKYIKVSTNLTRKYNHKVSNMIISNDKTADNLDNINNQVRNIVISEEFKSTELLDNLTLKLAPGDTEFIFSKYSKLINSNKINLNSFNIKRNENLILNTYRKNTGNNSKKGWRNIEYKYFIPGNIFKTNPKEIKLHLTGSYFIPFNTRAYLKVYLNSKLITVEELKESKYFEDKIVSIPSQEIQSYNNLKIVFNQSPDENLNKYSNIMETYINPESYITYSGEIVKKNNFRNLLSNFSGKGKILVVEKYKEELLKTAALLNNYIHKNNYSNLDFTIDYLENYNFDSEDNDLKWYMVIGGDKINDKVKSRVKLDGNNTQIKNKQTVENISINFYNPLSYIDLNTIDNKSVVFVNTSGSYDNLQKMLLEINKKESIYDLKGNLLIFNGENYNTFSIEKKSSIKGFETYLIELKNFLYKYKIYFYIISILLIILLLIWIYHKTKRKKNRNHQG